MNKKDLEIRKTIENILENTSPGQHLKNYFDGLPEKKIRRVISILSGIYPDKTISSDDDFSFVMYMFSDIKFMGQESFDQFVTAVNIFDFTDSQKKLLTGAIKNNIEILCNKCTFELGSLLVNLLEPNELFQYFEYLIEEGSRPVLHQVFDILLYEDFSNSNVSDEKIEILKQKISKRLSINNIAFSS
jgi:hypothetical protein